MVPPDQQPVFSLNPDKVVIEPKGSGSFVIHGLAHAQGEPREQLIVLASAGANAKATRRAFDVALVADVAAPLLDFSERTLEFRHSYVKGAPIEAIRRPLTLRNISKLPLSFSLKCGSPFSIDCASMQLEVDEAATVNVMLDPGFKGDLQSIVVPQKLRIEYTDNPQKDSVDLVSSLLNSA